ncbi:MAG TPA: hypothetical protein VLF42_06260 [Burkholderiales bacterium]|nr:hypothetical protein [Burkholderiales bacterium]
MKSMRVVLAAVLLAPLLPAHAAGEESPALGHALALIHVFVRIAAGLAKEMLADVPSEHRATLYAIGRDLAAVARKNLRNRPAER